MINKFKLYWSIQSAPSRALKSLMEIGKKHEFKYEDVSLDLTKNEQKSPKILAINPKGTIPFLVFNGEVLTESAAILRFLASTVDYLKRFYPTEPI